LSDMKRLALPGPGGRAAVALAAVLWLATPAAAQAQQAEPKADAKPESKGENFSAKPPAALFASDCTGAGCHKGPQGLAKAGGIGLAGFLREHYTNSRESAAALASYLAKLPSGPEPKEKGKEKEKETRTAKPASATPTWSERSGFFSSGEPGAVTRPDPREAKTPPPKPNTRTSRAPVKPEEETPDKPRSQPAAGEPGDSGAKSRAARAHAPAAAAAAVPEAVPMPPQPPAEQPPAASPPATQASAPPASTAPKHFDIFD